MSPVNLPFSLDDDYLTMFQKSGQKIKNKLLNRKNRIYTGNSLIIHIHGGGFIALESSDHQTYLNRWATKIQVPIFSIDYGLAPEHPFPESFDDVW